MATALNDLVHTVCRAAAADRLSAESDAALLDRLHPVWDAAAFEVLVRRHARTVLAAGRSVLRDDADVHDAFQATFLVLLRNAKTVRRGSSLSRWLYGVARKVALKARARAVAVGKREAKAAKSERLSDADPGWRETCDLLVRELARLPESYRRPIELCYFDGLTREEAAVSLGVSTGAVRGRLERGRQLLRERLERRGVSLSVGLLTLALTNSVAAVSPRLVQTVLSAASGPASPTVAALVEGFTVTGIKKGLSALVVCAVGVCGLAWWGFTAAAARPDDKPAMKADVPKAKAEKPTLPTVVAGTVTGPDGKPVAGAEVFVGYHRTGGRWAAGEDRSTAARVATTAADGTFTGDVPKDAAPYFWVYASKPGFGVAWVEPEYPSLTIADAGKLAFKLPADQPIAGRVLDTEGKPAVGVTVNVFTVLEPTNRDLNKLLKNGANGRFGEVGQWQTTLHPPAERYRTTTDKDGKFEIAGVGADRVVGLVVHGKGVARMTGLVVTRTGAEVGPLNARPTGARPTEKGRHHVFYGPAPTFVVEPGYAVEGVVTDKKAGKPVAGCQLVVNTGQWDRVTTASDKDGKYRFAGLTKGMHHAVNVMPPKEATVFPTWGEVPESKGYETATLDFALSSGAVFAGKVIDKETKQPVSASFQIIPTADNDFAKRPEYETASRDMVWKGGGADGKFRIVTLPGKSKVNVSVVPTQTLHGQPFHPYRGGQTLDIDLPLDSEKDHVIELDRGNTLDVAVVDEAGKPVTGLTVSGITLTNQDGFDQSRTFKLPAPDSKFTVFGLGEKEKRRLIVLQPAKKLAGTMLVGADAKATLTLVPLQPLTGCFTDADGKPLAGLTVGIDYDGYGEGPLVGEAGGFVLTAKTDAAGKFTIPAVVPGLPFSFSIQKGSTNYGGVPKLGRKTVTAGEPLELGTRKLEILD